MTRKGTSPDPTLDPALDPALRLGGVALMNGLVVVSTEHWAAAIREIDGSISVASGKKPRLPDGGQPGRGGYEGVPVVRGLVRFAESLMVLGLVKKRLPHAQLPIEGGRVAAALATSLAAGTAVRALIPRSPLAQETGTALAALIPAVLVVRNSSVAGYHGAEHKVIGAREEALRSAARGRAEAGDEAGTVHARAGGPGASARDTAALTGDTAALTGDAAAAAKEHERCGSNLVGPFLIASVLSNLLARGRSGRRTPLRSAVAGLFKSGHDALTVIKWKEIYEDAETVLDICEDVVHVVQSILVKQA